jgi:molybdopterin-guanine dinucleotide biosynthesis protein A
MGDSDRGVVVLVGTPAGETGAPALAPLGDGTVLRRVVERVSGAADAVVVVACPASLADACAAVVGDLSVPVVGPSDPAAAARIGAALERLATPEVAVVAGDMPGVDVDFLAYLSERRASTDAAVPRLQDGTPQPGQAIYDAEALREAAATALATGEGTISDVLGHLDAVLVSPAEVAQVTDWRSLARATTPGARADYETDE